jgi:dephospho-CoA kinase
MQMLSASKVADCLKPSPRILALTGGIGSGKSTVRRIFGELGMPCIDGDEVARNIHQNPLHPATVTITDAFPKAVTHDGRLIRGSLRKLVAIDNEANMKLKRILKPYVIAEMECWTQKMTTPYVVWESALIVEENIRCDRVLVVDAAENIRMVRILARNPDWTIDQIRNIFSIQLPSSDYLARADDVIRNDGSIADVKKQIEQLHHIYTKNWS